MRLKREAKAKAGFYVEPEAKLVSGSVPASRGSQRRQAAAGRQQAPSGTRSRQRQAAAAGPPSFRGLPFSQAPPLLCPRRRC